MYEKKKNTLIMFSIWQFQIYLLFYCAQNYRLLRSFPTKIFGIFHMPKGCAKMGTFEKLKFIKWYLDTSYVNFHSVIEPTLDYKDCHTCLLVKSTIWISVKL